MTVTAMGAYLNRLRPKLTNNWLVPDGRNNVVLTVEVQPDGTVGAVQLSSNPKNSVAEQAAFDSFSKAQPLEALPANLPVSKLTLTFVSNADPHGDSSSNVLTRLDPIATKAPTASATSPQK